MDPGFVASRWKGGGVKTWGLERGGEVVLLHR